MLGMMIHVWEFNRPPGGHTKYLRGATRLKIHLNDTFHPPPIVHPMSLARPGGKNHLQE